MEPPTLNIFVSPYIQNYVLNSLSFEQLLQVLRATLFTLTRVKTKLFDICFQDARVSKINGLVSLATRVVW